MNKISRTVGWNTATSWIFRRTWVRSRPRGSAAYAVIKAANGAIGHEHRLAAVRGRLGLLRRADGNFRQSGRFRNQFGPRHFPQDGGHSLGGRAADLRAPRM